MEDWSWRYPELRRCLSILAATADDQDRYLRSCGFTPEYGNDELALEFGDIFLAAGDMIQRQELTKEQHEAATPLDQRLADLSGEKNHDFWQRSALWSDERWQEIRSLAATALAEFPESPTT